MRPAPPRQPKDRPFQLRGDVLSLAGDEMALAKAAQAVEGHTPGRLLGGWATTYGKLLASGVVVPTVDRDDQIMECAREASRIDWSGYLKNGRGFWNDTHRGGKPGDRQIKVGIGTSLEFHGPSSSFAQAHGKVGWWTAGHLFDRSDPDSWRLYTDYVPTALDLERADHFWDLVTGLLEGSERTLGFSVDGLMRLSPCRRRIIWAAIHEIAVAMGPRNPDCTLEALVKAELPTTDPLAILRPGLIGLQQTPPPCGACSCPPGVCGLLRKAEPPALRAPVPRPQVPGLRAPRAPEAHLSSEQPMAETQNETPNETPAPSFEGALAELDALAKGVDGQGALDLALAPLDTVIKAEEEDEDEPSGDEDTGDEDTGDEDSTGEANEADPDNSEEVEDEDSTDPAEKAENEEPGDDYDEQLQKASDALMADFAEIVKAEIVGALGEALAPLQAELAKADHGYDPAELRTLKKNMRAVNKRMAALEKGLGGIQEMLKALAKGTRDGFVAINKAQEAQPLPAPVIVPTSGTAAGNASALRAGLGADESPAQTLAKARNEALAKADELLGTRQLTPDQHRYITTLAPDPVTALRAVHPS